MMMMMLCFIGGGWVVLPSHEIPVLLLLRSSLLLYNVEGLKVEGMMCDTLNTLGIFNMFYVEDSLIRLTPKQPRRSPIRV